MSAPQEYYLLLVEIHLLRELLNENPEARIWSKLSIDSLRSERSTLMERVKSWMDSTITRKSGVSVFSSLPDVYADEHLQ